ncbi:MAG: 16S rRNA (adenine(1518)-N(6)/adenine(1519)-N(6))-dimethyltransferase RsmA [Dehalococcoidia bacterium]|jgi:16S rRNA (adenine1518-N6/adenine1519-N6)-dimethyltransferase|nr:ribosomal RNA small subunit methyltransferase A [Chloroflexota bacterium]MDP6056571.1 16S rRNA (adenine(1518)-N(6)/adenine(1519)-N(6))-dimethyltransferase RsmA [Dehalococcoidia bacterium]MDP7089881.1 16S rRNA (adenine(1518)-N(6)/adenine(1519)-N(6))-dimethyltransferase RsmA [Dehalococcoidia bacterium]MDP7485192.1 16S rRNA (adenine(1518)-N(6)/adenine(1519)-N(6))-dimethyltransferase RsmA [Dehalococcoidia bacterium]|tara:strand:- start:2472 stop:3329 length:858 start_codon:yes stop_codon:yes gene_type:complete
MPPQRLGQHFLVDVSVINTIIEAADLCSNDTVVEIGPGRGALTDRLVEDAGRVLLLEYDTDLADRLAFKYESNSNVRVLNVDAREFGSDLDPWLVDSDYKVVANLPYYAANPITRNFLESSRKPVSMVIMVQREVANDMAARPGDMSLLSLAIQIYSSAEHVVDAPPECFKPPPKVHSSVLKLTPSDGVRISFENAEDFFQLARSGFKSPRKQLHNSLSDGLFIPVENARSLVEQTGFETSRRPATLSLDDWQVLYDVWVKAGRPAQVPGSVRRKRQKNRAEPPQ